MSLWSDSFAVRGPQDLEDLATASWLAETLFAALELGVFETLGEGELPLERVAERCNANPEAFSRFAEALSALGLLSLHDGRAACTATARRHLLPGRPGYLGHSLRYRQRLARTWQGLASAVRSGRSPIAPPLEEAEDSYRARVRAYLLAMDDVARHKAGLIADRLELGGLGSRNVLDLAGGAGAIAAEVLRRNPDWTGLVVDLPEVAEEARRLWAEGDQKSGRPREPASRLEFLGLDLLAADPPAPPGGTRWGLVIASNIVHAYGSAESGRVLDAAADALAEDGILVLHDFWTDGPGRGPLKSALFDLHMLLHTCQGRTHESGWVRRRLEARGLATLPPVLLGDRPGEEDTALIVAARREETLSRILVDDLHRLDSVARELGLLGTRPLPPEAVVTEEWVREKCRHGCPGYGKGGQCPPRSPAVADARATLAGYARALLVRGEPPAAEFHRRLLALERAAFLSGSHKALAFVAGPCRLCVECQPDGCRQPELARPSMEACGMDVYATARAVGWDLAPVRERGAPVTYVGLLLVD